ncbi:MAG: ATP-binding protein [Candidatus Micrarchaeota archaeon]
MLSKSVLGLIVKDQLSEFEALKDTVPRARLAAISSFKGSSAFVVKGVRRCGKSTLLKQFMKSNFVEDFYYFNFDDERISGFTARDFQPLMEVFLTVFGKRKNILFDEIQNIVGWELFVNRLLRQGYKLFITGSNANLLSKELGTHLTGRHVDVELYPFSFTEFLKAVGAKFSANSFYSTEEKAMLSNLFSNYFLNGGMPESTVFSNDSVLVQVPSDIIQKDVVIRYKIRKPSDLKAVAKFLLSNAGNLISYRSIADNFLISANTVQKYINYLEETYLIFTVHRFDRKIKRFDKNLKKVYCVDNGIVTKNTVSFNEKKGALLENLVAIHLKRIGSEVYYYAGRNSECDFVIPQRREAIQVCYDLDQNNFKRETKGLVEAMHETKATVGLILTFNQDTWKHLPKKVTVKPVWQWLLETEPVS